MKKKILIIDDDTDILMSLSFVLTLDHHIETTKDCAEIYQKIRAFKPDLIIMDLALEGGDGRDIAKHLKSKIATKNIPILMISGHPSASISAKRSGVDRFLPKPFGIDELTAEIQTIFGIKNSKKETVVIAEETA